jgi:hypothetical protein
MKDEPSGSLMHTATTESVSSRAPSTATMVALQRKATAIVKVARFVRVKERLMLLGIPRYRFTHRLALMTAFRNHSILTERLLSAGSFALLARYRV